MNFEIEDGILKKFSQDWSEKQKEIVIPPNVKEIGERAFFCAGISSVVLPEGLESIGNSAFYGCDYLKTIKLPKTLKTIGENAFSSCRKIEEVHVSSIAVWMSMIFENRYSNPLEAGRDVKLLVNNKTVDELSIPSGITKINDYAFANCRSIKKLTIPEGVVEVGENAFLSCDNLVEITLPSTIRKIGAFGLRALHLQILNIQNIESWLQIEFNEYNNLFSDSINSREEQKVYINGEIIEKLVIPKEVQSISDYAFLGWHCLKVVEISEGIKRIGKGAFKSCQNLQKVSIPETVEVIDESAFEHCTSIKEIVLPNSLTVISPSTFGGCKGLETINIPSSIVEIAPRAFVGCDNLKAIQLPQSVKYIRRGAFSHSGLTSIEIPEGIEEIEDETFNMCFSFECIKLPTSLKKIGRSAFHSCEIKEVYIHSLSQWISIEFVGNDSNPLGGSHGTIFKRSGGRLIIDGDEYTSLSLPSGVSSIGDLWFTGCAGFKNLSIPEGVVSIGSNAFSGCPNIESIILPNSIQTISDHAFSYCPKLKTVSIPNGITSIESSVFCGCESLDNVILSSTLNQIGYGAFEKCVSLKNIDIPQNVKAIGENAFSKSGLNSIIIPDGTETIERSAFSQCEQLEEVNISSTVSNLASEAFSQCSALTKVVIQSRFDTISKDAFAKCSNIKEVYIIEDQFEAARDYFLKKVRFYTIDGMKLGKPENKGGSNAPKKTVATKTNKQATAAKKRGNIMETKVIYPDGASVSPVTDVIVYSKDKPKSFVKPEIKEATVILEGNEFNAVFKIASKLPSIWKRFYTEKENGGIYDPDTALKAAQQSDGFIDDSTGSYVSCPLYGQIPESTQALTPNEIESRLKAFVLIANQCIEEKTLLKIANALPKKKNGMLHKGRLVHITYLDLVDYDGSTYEIVAKNEDDSQFCVEIRSNVPVVNDLFYQSFLL